MESSAQRCSRILTALEDLVAQEWAALRAREFDTACDLQDRAAPLVDFLASQRLDEVNDETLRSRIADLHLRRQQTADWLSAEITLARAELQQTCLAQRRVAQIVPAYGHAATPQSQLRAIG